MKLTVLLDNNTYIDQYYLGEPGVSYLIEDGEKSILFDTGYSEVFLENARRMGLDLTKVTDLVLSHGHNDHTGGLRALIGSLPQEVSLYAHPDVFLPKRAENMSIGAPVTQAELPPRIKLHLSKDACSISEHVAFLGEIKRTFAFEAGNAIGEYEKSGKWKRDFLFDDSAAILMVEQGIFVISGYAHSGICNIVAQAKRLYPDQPIEGLLGGFHLFACDERLGKTLDALQTLGVTIVYPCHCTSFEVKCAFAARFQVREVGVGMTLDFET